MLTDLGERINVVRTSTKRENIRKYQTEVTEVNTTDKCTGGAQEQTKQSRRMVQQASE